MNRITVNKNSKLLKIVYSFLFVVLFFFNFAIVIDKDNSNTWLQAIRIEITNDIAYADEPRYPGAIRAGYCGYGACVGELEYCMSCKTDPWANECDLFNEICFDAE